MFARHLHSCFGGSHISASLQVRVLEVQLESLCTQYACGSQRFERILQSESTWQGGHSPRIPVAGLPTHGATSTWFRVPHAAKRTAHHSQKKRMPRLIQKPWLEGSSLDMRQLARGLPLPPSGEENSANSCRRNQPHHPRS